MIFGELVGRSINPLNGLLLSLATASYFLGEQRAAIVMSISLGFDKLRRMVSVGHSDMPEFVFEAAEVRAILDYPHSIQER